MKEPLRPDQELNKNIIELSATIKRVNSIKFNFLRGIVVGVGTFIGATVVAAIAITLLVHALSIFNIDIGIRDYLNSLLPKTE